MWAMTCLPCGLAMVLWFRHEYPQLFLCTYVPAILRHQYDCACFQACKSVFQDVQCYQICCVSVRQPLNYGNPTSDCQKKGSSTPP